ncbi:MAG: peptidoglycan DD-metalloendopeptidase family protein [Chitinophagales bacterium]
MKIQLAVFLLYVSLLVRGQEFAPAGGGNFNFIPQDEINQNEKSKILNDIHQNIALLKQNGMISHVASKTAALDLIFPLAWADGFAGYNFYGISNYVDHNEAYPGFITDYNCGSRSYDTEAGYNHSGIDYFLWPFDWNLMEAGAVKIIAAAPGMIVGKYDGQADHSCSMGGGSWNAVYIRHDDGSLAWYGHMKNGSLTTKGLGELVETGEYLGLVGSSGNSTGPHLHFELYDADDNLLDPYSGTCNDLNAESWWADQPEYMVPVINKIQTNSMEPIWNPCPEPSEMNDKNEFMPGENAYFVIYAKDLSPADDCHLKIERADGSVWYEWDFFQDVFYAASYWYWWYTIPEGVPEGTWKWSCTLSGNYYEHEFLVGEFPAAIQESSPIKNMLVYLNENAFQLNLTATNNFEGEIILTNMTGQHLVCEQMDFLKGDNKFDIPANRYAAGAYLISVFDLVSGKNSSLKFIKF